MYLLNECLKMKTKLLFAGLSFWVISGFGQFGPQQIISTDTSKPYLSIPYDVDKDGLIDVVAASGDNFLLSWYKNLGDGVFGAETILNHNPVFYLSIHFEDLDLDGHTDILFHKNNPSEIAWLQAVDNEGSFYEEEVLLTSQNFFFRQILPFDVDEDGLKDILALRSNSFFSEIVWYRNLGDGIFDVPKVIYQHEDQLSKMVLADINSDGKIDLLIADMTYEPATIFWLQNIGNENFGDPGFIFQFQNLLSHFTDIEDIQVADLNSDGKIDIVIKSFNESSDFHLHWIENLDNQGNFGWLQLIKSGYTDFLLCDLVGEGDMDLLLWSRFSNRVSYIKNENGMVDFQPERIISTDVNFPRDAHVVDLDNDGLVDVISASSLDHKIAWYPRKTLEIVNTTKEKTILYPNPTTDLIHIHNFDNLVKAELFDISGRKITEFTDAIDLSEFDSGIYLLRLTNGAGENQTFKVRKE